jgi:NADH:ubiquinone oxidoreductase subunit F (NADH-binding)
MTGDRALDEALGRPRTKLLSARELSGLRVRGGAGFQTEKK